MSNMEKTKVLFVHQEITPYLEENPISLIGRNLPEGMSTNAVINCMKLFASQA